MTAQTETERAFSVFRRTSMWYEGPRFVLASHRKPHPDPVRNGTGWLTEAQARQLIADLTEALANPEQGRTEQP